MAAHGARRLLPMVENACGVVGIELLAAAQGCDFPCAARRRARRSKAVRALLRAEVPHLDDDRHFHPDMKRRSPWCARARGEGGGCSAAGIAADVCEAVMTQSGGTAPLSCRTPRMAASARANSYSADRHVRHRYSRPPGSPSRAARRRCSSAPAYGHRSCRARVRLVSPWLARKDADYWVDVLYDFAHELGATTIRTALSRTVIDVNRDPSGASLYPGQATTGLCPTETFDGEPLINAGRARRRGDRAPPRETTSIPIMPRSARACTAARAGIRASCSTTPFDPLAAAAAVRRRAAAFNIGTNNGMSCDP